MTPTAETVEALVERLNNRVLIETSCGNRTENPRNHVRLMDEAAQALSILMERERVLKESNDKLAGLLYEACGGFPVSKEAFAAVAADLPVVACEMSRPFKGRPLSEFRAEILKALSQLNTVSSR